jgi:hypothetical protein
MRTGLPGLLVLRIILLAGLACLFFGSDWTTTDRVDPKSGYVDLGHLSAVAVEFRVHSSGSKPFLVQRSLPSGASVEMVFTAPESRRSHVRPR